MSKTSLKTKFKGAILGTAIGDALGAPMEMMTRDQIALQVPILNDYVENIDRPRGIHQNVRKAGEWTDDTQLSTCGLKSILNKAAIDPLDHAAFMVETFLNEPLRGWSKSTTKATERLSQGIPWFRAAEGSLGIGNGVAMKAAPLGLYLGMLLVERSAGKKDNADVRHCLNSIVSVGKITHTELGIAAGLLQSALISFAVNGVKNRSYILKELTNTEKEFFGNTYLTNKIKKIIRKKLSIEQLADTCGLSGKAEESWVAVAVLFMRTKNKKQAIENLFKLIQQGADCDTTGSMYGALIGARWGLSTFPKHLIDKVEKSTEFINLSEQLYCLLNEKSNMRL